MNVEDALAVIELGDAQKERRSLKMTKKERRGKKEITRLAKMTSKEETTNPRGQ